MRNVIFVGAGAALVYVVMNRAIWLLNAPTDLGVATGYFLLLALVAAATQAAMWLWRRR